jgi:hypothetical protein
VPSCTSSSFILNHYFVTPTSGEQMSDSHPIKGRTTCFLLFIARSPLSCMIKTLCRSFPHKRHFIHLSRNLPLPNHTLSLQILCQTATPFPVSIQTFTDIALSLATNLSSGKLNSKLTYSVLNDLDRTYILLRTLSCRI